MTELNNFSATMRKLLIYSFMHDGYGDFLHENHLNMISSQILTTQNDGDFLQQRCREDANSSAFIGHRLFIYYLTQKSLPDSMIYQIIQSNISGLCNKESNSARRLFVK